MKVLYSKNAVQALLAIPEPHTANLLKNINSIAKRPSSVPVTPIPGASDRKRYFRQDPYYVVLKQTLFRGSTVLYVMEILQKEDFDYYIN